MRIDIRFRHVPHSDDLIHYIHERVEKLSKFEMKPVRIEVTLSSERTRQRVDVLVRGDHLEYFAHSEGIDFFQAVDEVVAKVAKQLSRRKSKLQTHKVS